MRTYHIADALNEIAFGACWTCEADEDGNFNFDNIVWQDDQIAKPEAAAVQTKLDALIAAEPMRYLREVRDEKLAETDVWVLADRSPTQAQLDYRQALRDLPASTVDPLNVVWPTKPEGN